VVYRFDEDAIIIVEVFRKQTQQTPKTVIETCKRRLRQYDSLLSTTMDKNKRKRLESAGWKVGTAPEFLGLSAQESAYIELKLQLAKNLLKRRQAKKLTQTDLARIIKSSQSRVAKMESGDPSVSLDLLVRSLLALGASARYLQRVLPH